MTAGFAAFLFALSLVSTALASGPSSNRVLNYQLRLTSASGVPVADGNQNIKLTFYTASSGGTQLYTACSADGTATGTPTAAVVAFTNGQASVLIGSTLTCASGSSPAIPATLFDNASIFLGVTVASDSEMTPRKRIVAAGYSLNADKLDDLETSSTGGSNAFVPVTDSSGNFTLTKDVTIDTTTLKVDSTNNRVGIGTASPASPLDIANGAGNQYMFKFLADGGGGETRTILHFTADTGPTVNGYVQCTPSSFGAIRNSTCSFDTDAANGMNIGTLSSAPITFYTGGDLSGFERMTIAASGSVGIGDTTPDALLDVAGTFQFDGNGVFGDAAGDSLTINGTAVSVPNNLNVDSNTFFVDSANNRVGVGTTTPPGELQVASSSSSNTQRGVMSSQHNDGVHAAQMHFRKSRGTNGSPTTVANGDYIGTYHFQPFVTTSGYIITSSWGARVNGTVTGTSAPTEFFIGTNSVADGDPFTNGSVRLLINATGNVGIGTTSPGAKLHVDDTTTGATSSTTLRLENDADNSGEYNEILMEGITGADMAYIRAQHEPGVSDTSLRFGTQTAASSLTTQMTIQHDGLVGIGTTSPGSLLHLLQAGGAKLRFNSTTNPSYDNSWFTDTNSHVLNSTTVGSTNIIINNDNNSGTNDGFAIWKNTASGTPMFMINGDTSRAGFFTSNPFAGQLHVDASASGGVGGQLWITNSGAVAVGSIARLAFGPDATTDTTPNAGIENIVTNAGTLTSDLAFKIYDGSGYNEKMRIESTGEVGIGATAPSARLELLNTSGGDILEFNNTGSVGGGVWTWSYAGGSSGNLSLTSAWDNFVISVDTDSSASDRFEVLRQGATGFGLFDGAFGIGTASPNAKLDVRENAAAATVKLQNSSASGWSAIDFYNSAGTLAGYVGWGNGSVSNYPNMAYFGTDGANPATFVTNNARRMTIDSSGNVGIGDTTPDALLDVAGSFQNDGNAVIGDAASDTLTLNAELVSHVLPDVDDTYDLGSNSQRWRDLYLGPATLHIGTSTIDEGALTYNTTTNVLNIDSTGAVDVNGGSGSTGCSIDASGNLACSGTVSTASSSGTQGWWSRSGTTLSPVNSGDNVSTTGFVKGATFTNHSSPTVTGNLIIQSTTGTATMVVPVDDSTDEFVVQTAGGATAFVVDTTNKRVGIGTGTPGQLLELVGGENSSIDLRTGGLTLRSSVNTVAGAQFGTVSAHTLNLFTSNTNRLTILSDGKVGIGDSSPEYLFSVDGKTFIDGSAVHGGAGSAILTVDGDSGTDIVEFRDFNAASQFVIESDGKTGIGTSNPITQLHVPGKVPSATTGSVATGSTPVEVYVQGRYAYVANQGADTLQIFDVSNPASMLSVGSVATGTDPLGVVVQGHYAFVSNTGSATVQAFDVSDPASPTSIATVSTDTLPSHMYAQGRYLYVVNFTSGTLQIIDISNPAAMAVVGSVATGSQPDSVYVQGRYAFVTNSAASTLQAFDVSNPASPSSVSTVATGSTPRGVYVQGRYAYVANQNANTLQIFDVKNPASMSSVGSVGLAGSYGDRVHVQGRYAYLNSNTVLQTIDVSNPSSPSSVGSVSIGDSTLGMFVQGRYAFVANYADSFLVSADLGGAYLQQLEAGGIETGTLSVRNNLQALDGDFRGGLTVGQNFHVSRDAGVMGDLFMSTDDSTITFSAADGTNSPMMQMFASGTSNGARMVLAHSPSFTNWGLQYDDSPDKFNFISSGSPVLTADLGNLRVGIGTSSPSALLDISTANTDFTASVARITNTSATGQSPLDFYINGTMRGKYRVDYVGNVNLVANGGDFNFFTGGDSGTGTQRMQILSGGDVLIGQTTAVNSERLLVDKAGTDTTGQITISSAGDQNAAIYYDNASSFTDWLAGINNGTLGATDQFYFRDVTNANTKMIIGAATNAIRIDLPAFQSSQRLCHSGSDSASAQDLVSLADCSAGGSDLAEYSMVTDADAEPGDLVYNLGTDPMRPTIMRKAKTTRPYQPNVSGVISTAPFVEVLGGDKYRDVPGAWPIVLAGRVPVKVSLENGPIRAGDALVPSSVPGVAMKAGRDANIVGYAEEDYDPPVRVSAYVLDQEQFYNRDNPLKPYHSDPAKWPAGVGKIMMQFFPTYFDVELAEGASDDGGLGFLSVTSDAGARRLSLAGLEGEELAYFGANGDIALKGNLYPSDNGLLQSNRYIAYDGARDRMITNASTWASTGDGIAQAFASADSLAPGEIVMLDLQDGGKVKRALGAEASVAYLAMGVTVERPGFLAGMDEEKPYAVAMTGRADVRVVGSVSIGDPITMSLTAGVGVKAEGPTYVVGIAMGAHEGTGAGTVPMYVRPGWWNGTGIETADSPISGDAGNTALAVTDTTIDFNGRALLRLGALEGLDGTWSIDAAGKLTATEVDATTLRGDAVVVKAPAEKPKTVGRAMVETGKDAALVLAEAVKANSLIVVTFDKDPGSRWWLDERHDGAFIVKLGAPAIQDATFTYWIVTIDGELSEPVSSTAAPVAPPVVVEPIVPAEPVVPEEPAPSPEEPATEAETQPAETNPVDPVIEEEPVTSGQTVDNETAPQ